MMRLRKKVFLRNSISALDKSGIRWGVKPDCRCIYLFTDILLLAVFEQFRAACLGTYQLDPAHYYTAPGQAWDACLNLEGVTLQTLADIDQHQFIEHGTRGEMSFITHRYAQVNNNYLKDYDPEQATSRMLGDESTPSRQ